MAAPIPAIGIFGPNRDAVIKAFLKFKARVFQFRDFDHLVSSRNQIVKARLEGEIVAVDFGDDALTPHLFLASVSEVEDVDQACFRLADAEVASIPPEHLQWLSDRNFTRCTDPRSSLVWSKYGLASLEFRLGGWVCSVGNKQSGSYSRPFLALLSRDLKLPDVANMIALPRDREDLQACGFVKRPDNDSLCWVRELKDRAYFDAEIVTSPDAPVTEASAPVGSWRAKIYFERVHVTAFGPTFREAFRALHGRVSRMKAETDAVFDKIPTGSGGEPTS